MFNGTIVKILIRSTKKSYFNDLDKKQQIFLENGSSSFFEKKSKSEKINQTRNVKIEGKNESDNAELCRIFIFQKSFQA